MTMNSAVAIGADSSCTAPVIRPAPDGVQESLPNRPNPEVSAENRCAAPWPVSQ